jgi:hypothetical protein
MASCAYRASTILFGGQTVGNMRFCNARCRGKGRVAQLAAPVSDGEARSLAIRILGGPARGQRPPPSVTAAGR